MGGAVSAQVLRSGEPWLATTLDAAALERLSGGDTEHLRLLKESGLCSALAVPLASRGHVLGGSGWAAPTPRGPSVPRSSRWPASWPTAAAWPWRTRASTARPRT